MKFFDLTCALVAISLLLAASPADGGEIGVAPVVMSGEPDRLLVRKIEDALVHEVRRLRHEVTRPVDIAPHLAGYDRSRVLTTDEWVIVARFLELDALVTVRMKLVDRQLTLVLRVVFPDGRRDESKTLHTTPADGPHRARQVLAKWIGQALVEEPQGPAIDPYELKLAIHRQEARYKRGQIVAGVVSPLVLAFGVGLGSYFMYRGRKLDQEEEAEDDDGHVGGMMIGPGFGYQMAGLLFIALGTAGAIATLVVGCVWMGKSRRVLRRLEPQVREPFEVSVAPIVGPHGTFGAGAVVYF